MRSDVPASATEVFKNERRELPGGVMVKSACLVEETVGENVMMVYDCPFHQE